MDARHLGAVADAGVSMGRDESQCVHVTVLKYVRHVTVLPRHVEEDFSCATATIVAALGRFFDFFNPRHRIPRR